MVQEWEIEDKKFIKNYTGKAHHGNGLNGEKQGGIIKKIFLS